MKRLTLFLLLIVWAMACTSRPLSPVPQHIVSADEAGYSVLNIKDISMWTLEKNSKPSRKRLDVSIMAPTAKTFESRGQTVVAACRALQSQNSADVVRVWLEPNDNTRGLGFVLAMATYSPDGKGMSGMGSNEVWDNVTVTDYQISNQALKFTKATRLSDISVEQAKIIESRHPYTPRLAETSP